MTMYKAVTVREDGRYAGGIIRVTALTVETARAKAAYELSKNPSRTPYLAHWEDQGCPMIVEDNTKNILVAPTEQTGRCHTWYRQGEAGGPNEAVEILDLYTDTTDDFYQVHIVIVAYSDGAVTRYQGTRSATNGFFSGTEYVLELTGFKLLYDYTIR